MQLTPVTSTPSDHQQPGQVVWHDLLTDDVAAAKEFYGQLFGWTFEQQDQYVVILNNGVPIAGMVTDSPVDEGNALRASWAVYLSVRDVDQAAMLVEKNDGRVVQKPAEMVNRGRYVIVNDPQGAPFVLLRSASGDPQPPAEPAMGGWLWDELWARDPAAVVDFYQALGEYTAQQVNTGEESPYWVLVSGSQWQAGITVTPFEDALPQWVPVIRVADPTAVAEQAAALGGKVLLTPDNPLCGGDLSLIEDPSGGIVMVESWQPEDSLSGKEQ
jgi:predicted enzyme related to lactoylglutathione lyase